ncbi:hypothetical protein P175DRAFT_0502597 [Aspergillus ochraceoroseus IBT 24754]|uniref:HD/PDEase domain-containing protein n=1 Tax=Aspergillus ochraceoroseus IBT 24754 TaxID=1392256 RepID=A0A2T5LS28_9EURO|nr:uncharacterized protein P175DRAFT_0502597 [Aspergillus ochraceoroseus IBT 24754]PTU19090.1 hypothetical protein P175DRAFT_0502597 [Aspergillus ochraceoroseus IBT 24754]
MSSSFKAGYFQTWEFPTKDEVLIHDQLYGDHLVTEPVLVELLKSPAVLRLQGICQHGVTGFLGLSPRVTRLEHSVGAFLLVRSVAASLAEQIAALLHDISHTTLSHVIDWAMSKPGEESFHEVHKARYIKMTNLPAILAKHGFGGLEPLDETLFPLVERPAPHLCADRLDYALRDTVGCDKLPLPRAREIFASLVAFPDVSHAGRLLVLKDAELALSLARAYLAMDRDVWSNRANVDMYARTGRVIATVINQGCIDEEQLWKLSDDDFWALLRKVADPESLKALTRLETEGLPQEEGLDLPRAAKIRTIDPDVLAQDADTPRPLSVILPSWGDERKQYILGREATMV